VNKIWASLQRIGIKLSKPIPDPGFGVKKAPDPGSGSATLGLTKHAYFVSLELEHSTSSLESSDPARRPRESSEQARLLLLNK
jgi:hypothetical protein